MVRRDAVVALGGIPAEFRVIPDYFLCAEVTRQYEARAVERVVCRYRLHANNMSRYTRRRENEEALLLVDRVESDLPPALARSRKRVHATLLAVDALCSGRPFAAISTLAARGSIMYLLSRPWVILFRIIRRRLQTPRWRARP